MQHHIIKSLAGLVLGAMLMTTTAIRKILEGHGFETMTEN